MALEETDPNYQQNIQLSVLVESAITNNSTNSLNKQIIMITQEDLLSDIEILPKKELAIYSYETPHLSASCISKTASSSDKNKKTDGLITVTNRKTKKGNRISKKKLYKIIS
ncbi:5420_t:CDS:1 [Cetraspora pellucida]|uniref:5420_t:CDS:1 n=1 Tax=Cetraspora pellucida TaxID=1433469 RepID=A0A9N9E3H1_9GLOM|nr:5420_t:CDS:1 [Cetraspora pellucida]